MVNSSLRSMAEIEYATSREFQPPPGATKLHLELWRRVFSLRCQQIQTLSSANLGCFANVIASDLKTSRLKHVGGGGDEQQHRKIDLASGHYSSFLMSHCPSQSVIASADVARHINALFYRSVDERLSPDERVHGLDAVKRAFIFLENALIDQSQNLSSARDPHKATNNGRRNDGSEIRTSSQGRAEPPPADSISQRQHGKSVEPSTSVVVDKEVTLQEKEGNEHTSKRSREEAVVINNGANSAKEQKTTSSRNDDAPVFDGKNTATIRSVSQEEKGEGEPTGKQTSDKLVSSQTSLTTQNSQRQHGKSGEPSTSCVVDKELTLQEKEGNKHTSKRSREEAVPNNGAFSAKEQKTTSSRNDDAPVFDGKNTATIRSVSQEEKGEGELEPTGKQASDKIASSQTSLTTQNESSSSSEKQMTVLEDVVTDSPALFPPTSLPPPIPVRSMRTIPFLPDDNSPVLASASLRPRQSCVLMYDAGFNLNGSGASLDDKSFVRVRDRLEQWDPYWKVVKELGRQEMSSARDGRMTLVATRTTSGISAVNACTHNLPTSCALINVDLPSEFNNEKSSDASSLGVGGNENPWGLRWGESVKTYETGDRRLLLRMLPLTRTEYEAKAHSDNHQWPIGTFIQLSRGTSQQALLISQRRQQSHDPTLWKGLCHPLDVTSILKISDSPFSLKICAREIIEKAGKLKHNIGSLVSKVFEGDDGELRPFAGTIESYDEEYNLYKVVYEDGDTEELTYEEVLSISAERNDDQDGVCLKGSYAVHLAVCEYIAPDNLYDDLIKRIQKISLEASRAMAKRYLQSQTVSIDSDSEGGDSSSSSSLTLSLLCPLSMSAIKTPIRGRHCKHMQCFDMKTFLHYNKHISGGRWRCGVCEDFLSVRDLVLCGLYETMLLEYKDKVSVGHDKVSFRSDGSWSLKDENKPRCTSKSRGVVVSEGDAESVKISNDTCQKRLATQPEIIDLL